MYRPHSSFLDSIVSYPWFAHGLNSNTSMVIYNRIIHLLIPQLEIDFPPNDSELNHNKITILINSCQISSLKHNIKLL